MLMIWSTFIHRGALGASEVVVFMAFRLPAVLHCP